MLSNPVCRKPFRGARQEVSGAALEREGAANKGEHADVSTGSLDLVS